MSSWPRNWRDKAEYPSDALYTEQYFFAWAWEYLRRNKNYQELYNSEVGEWPDLNDADARAAFAHKVYSPDLRASFAFHFGVETPMHYRSDIPPKFSVPQVIRRPFHERLLENIQVQHNEVIVRLDLEAAIGDQFRALEKYLKNIKKEENLKSHKVPDAHQHIRNLRLLDAQEDNVDIEDMCEIILGSHGYKTAKEAVSANMTSAKKFLNGGYKLIASKSIHLKSNYHSKFQT